MKREMWSRRLYPDARPTSMRRYSAGGARVAFRTDEASLPVKDPLFFLEELRALGAQSPLVERFRAFLGGSNSYASATLLARMLQDRPRIPVDRKVAMIFAAAILDRTSRRTSDDSARVAQSCAFLVGDAATRETAIDFGARFRFGAEHLRALLLSADGGGDEESRRARRARAENALASSFPGDARALEWGRMLAFADRACVCLAVNPSLKVLEKLHTLRMDPMFISLPADVAKQLMDLSARLEATARQPQLALDPQSLIAPLRGLSGDLRVAAAA